jgi:hypothetical protein
MLDVTFSDNETLYEDTTDEDTQISLSTLQPMLITTLEIVNSTNILYQGNSKY